jgi:hypothetical protein
MKVKMFNSLKTKFKKKCLILNYVIWITLGLVFMGLGAGNLELIKIWDLRKQGLGLGLGVRR